MQFRSLQQAHNPVCIAYCRDFRGGNYYRFLGRRGGVLEPPFNPGRAVYQDVFVFLLKFSAQFPELGRFDAVLVTGLSRRNEV